MSTIHGSWETTKIICGNHGGSENIEMVPQQGGLSMFYACPKYHPENREDNEKPCFNRINLLDYTDMLDHIASVLVDAEEHDEMINLKNHKWTKKGIEYTVMSHTPTELVIKVLNKKSLKKSMGV